MNARRDPYDGDDEGPDDDPLPEDVERFGSAIQTCPHCKTEVYDDADICWKCGMALRAEEKPVPIWAIVAAVVVLIALVLIVLR